MAAENHVFQTEVKKMLDLLANSLYSNKEVFLRELISNASDAVEKLRFNALQNAELLGDDPNLKVRISFDKDAKTLTISDNGIGMTKDEVINHLGTIAHSGTADFFSNLGTDQAKNSELIGQFGVGFYSSFIVADKVVVNSRSANACAAEGVSWVSTGDGSFTTETINKENRGTDIILFMKDDETEFLNTYKLEEIITKYSNHIGVPVELYKEVVDEDAPEEKDEEGKVKPKPRISKWVQVNSAIALWTKNPKDVSDDDYKKFYLSLANTYGEEEPLTWSHNKVEGSQEYTSLLYIPSKAPWDLFNHQQKHGLKLYVQRVFIMDDAEQFMPTYLRFVKGLIDSNDLPLNVSREILQNNRITQSMKKACTKKVLGMLEKLAKDDPEKYQSFWTQFGNVLKEGPAEDYSNTETIAKLLRFASTKNDSDVQNVSLEDYISRMPEKQKNIYYLISDSYKAAANSAHIEILKNKGVEVLLLWDKVDEWLMSNMSEFQGKKFISALSDDLELGDLVDEEDKKKAEEKSKEYESVIKRFKDALGDKVEDVKISSRLVDTPCCAVSNAAINGHLISTLKALGQKTPDIKYVLELNMEHPLVTSIIDEADEDRFKEWSQFLLDQALLGEQGSLEDPSTFIKLMNKLLVAGK
ncbi:MAG: molecular chaperone HtpG [Succinivibrionaceae bacterium]|nr:molecular chaperone HtpG [Succinivibrionaceae bacterium]